jgi:hypothetical protein
VTQRRNVPKDVAVARAKKAAAARWGRAGSREAASETGRARVLAYWEREVDPDGTLPADVREKLARQARTAYMRKLAVASQVKRARQQAEAQVTPADPEDPSAA